MDIGLSLIYIFLMRYDVYINDIYDLQISQNLLGVKGASLADIKQVYSKDQAIYQSKKFLEGRGYELIPVSYTHLDVYKRQASMRSLSLIRSLPAL